MKQYLMMCDERGVDILSKAFRPEMIQFLEVQGMPMGNDQPYNMIISPTSQIAPQISTPQENVGINA
jgi:hypothetical protein